MSTVDPDSPRRLRLLIIDEHPISSKVLALIFRQRGYACAVALTADAAIDAVTTHQPDAVVLEWYFRDGQGTGLPALLRAHAAAHRCELVIVALSVVESFDAPRVREAVDDYFVKPTAIELLDRRIRELLHAAGRQSSQIASSKRPLTELSSS